ncbi:hypothetical protein A4H96_15125 [Acidithiobacillus ferrooxidans]|jgi:hypothetical protein|uniref:Uncharacterized protein n=1 Tax=Acidithiobacillus ferrooxidans TaxID=920 RepID=A0A179B6C2_ACIFR|nr:hypothetical protein A4H96_15125 [Acidithiobacillus ferrooxidans]
MADLLCGGPYLVPQDFWCLITSGAAKISETSSPLVPQKFWGFIFPWCRTDFWGPSTSWCRKEFSGDFFA